jgi:hypothetical protein
MKKILAYTCMLFLPALAFSRQRLQTVNAILGDQSFLRTWGIYPDAGTNEQLRVQTHLAYVERLLRATAFTALTASQQTNRAVILDILHEYWLAGKFPVNREYPHERRPCFIDADGNICAVGYLIARTKGREAVQRINSSHQYDFLLDMNEPSIAVWAEEYGLTLEECAMIQPGYGWIPDPAPVQTTYVDIKTGYGVSSGIVGGTNLAISIANISGRWNYSPVLSYVGIVTGAGQVIMGITNIKKPFTGEGTLSYRAQNNLSYINIALGSTTIISSALNMVINKKAKEKRNAFNLYSTPNYANSVTMGLSFRRSL